MKSRFLQLDLERTNPWIEKLCRFERKGPAGIGKNGSIRVPFGLVPRSFRGLTLKGWRVWPEGGGVS